MSDSETVDAPVQGRLVSGEQAAKAEPLYPAARLLKGNVIEAAQTLEAAQRAITAVKADAARIRQESEAELERLRDEARRQGEQRAAAEFAKLLESLSGEIEAFKADAAERVKRLVFAFAKSVLDAELKCQPDVLVELVRSVLEKAKAYSQIAVVLHPDDLANVRKHGESLLDALPFAEQLQFREDAGLQLHGCRIETEMGTFDGSLEVQLSRMHEHLAQGGDLGAPGAPGPHDHAEGEA